MTAQAIGAPAGSAFFEHQGEARPAHWGGVFAMTLCVFALIASEFLPVSLLTPMAADLRVTEGMAGQGIAISGAFAVLTSLSISAVAVRINRKTLLLSLTAMMCLSGVIVALAPNYLTYMAGRALIGVVVGGFWSMSAATAMQLVPPAKVPRALAIFNGGNALATVVAAPLGSYLASIVGWRGAFFCLVPVAVIAFVWQWFSLPAMRARPRAPGSGNVFRLFRRRLVTLGMLAAGVFFMGQFALFTYLRPFLEAVTRVDVSTLSLILLTLGVAGFLGTTVIGRFLKRGFYGTLTIIPLMMGAIALMLIALGTSVAATTVLLGVWGLAATAAPVGWWTWIARTLPQDAEAGGGLMVAVVQLSIALGSTVGGVLFDTSGYRSTFAFSAGLLVVGALLVLSTARADHAEAWGEKSIPASLVVAAADAGAAPIKPKESRMWMTVGERRFAVTLADNAAANAFAARLPLTLDMAELNGNEKHADLPKPLPANATRPGTIRNGDLMLYGTKTVVVFYSTFDSSYSYTYLGRVDDPAGLAQALGRRGARVEFSNP
ncbi:MAG TPA: MFS transporter [Rhodanobacter sp.]